MKESVLINCTAAEEQKNFLFFSSVNRKKKFFDSKYLNYPNKEPRHYVTSCQQTQHWQSETCPAKQLPQMNCFHTNKCQYSINKSKNSFEFFVTIYNPLLPFISSNEKYLLQTNYLALNQSNNQLKLSTAVTNLDAT